MRKNTFLLVTGIVFLLAAAYLAGMYLPLRSGAHGPAGESGAEVKISANYESRADLSAFTSIFRLTQDREGDGGQGVLIRCDQTVRDFTVTHMDYDHNSQVFREKEILFILPQVEPGQAVLLITYLPEIIPQTKISFRTATGNEINRLLSWSGENGDVLLLGPSPGFEF